MAQSTAPNRKRRELTEREKEIIRLAQAHTDDEIAARLTQEGKPIKSSTVRSHWRHIHDKLGSNNRTHAVVISHQEDLVPIEPIKPIDE